LGGDCLYGQGECGLAREEYGDTLMTFSFFWGTSCVEEVPVETQPIRQRQTLSLAKPRSVNRCLTEVRGTVTVKVRETAPAPKAEPQQAKAAKPKKSRAAIKAEKRAKAEARREESYHPGEQGPMRLRRGVMIHHLPLDKMRHVQ